VASFERGNLTRMERSLNSDISSCVPSDLSRFAGEVIKEGVRLPLWGWVTQKGARLLGGVMQNGGRRTATTH